MLWQIMVEITFSMFLQLHWLLIDDIDQISKLMLAENDLGFGPIKLCMKYGCYKLFLEFFHTEGVFLKNELNSGLLSIQYYEVPEYSYYGSRALKSPFEFLRYVDDKKTERLEMTNILGHPIIAAWINSDFKNHIIPTLLWGILETLLCIFGL